MHFNQSAGSFRDSNRQCKWASVMRPFSSWYFYGKCATELVLAILAGIFVLITGWSDWVRMRTSRVATSIILAWITNLFRVKITWNEKWTNAIWSLMNLGPAVLGFTVLTHMQTKRLSIFYLRSFQRDTDKALFWTRLPMAIDQRTVDVARLSNSKFQPFRSGRSDME